MPYFLDNIEAAAPDPLLGLMLAARKDDRPYKTDLGVGVYKDAHGQTPILRAVHLAEESLLRTETSKAYEGPQGNAVYCEKISELFFGEGQRADRAAFTTPGGCGALFIGLALAKAMSPDAAVWVSDPTWPNHHGVAKAEGMVCRSFPYRADASGCADVALILDGLTDAKPGDVVLLQGPCHNPTGTDLSPEGWRAVAEFIAAKGLLPFIDVAYQGFGRGLAEDVAPIRSITALLPELLMSYSCSKNFGLYRERTGALFVQAPNAALLEKARGRTASIVRSAYSMPPSHGAAIVADILSSREKTSIWQDELSAMRARMTGLRRGFADALKEAADADQFEAIAQQAGMFSILPLKNGAAEALRKEHAIYLPGSGRINIAGLPEDRLESLAATMAPYLDIDKA